MTSTCLHRFEAPNSIACHRAGAGSPVVLVHGVGLRAESFGPQIAFLKKSHCVYAIDLPGHGESAGFGNTGPDLGDYTARLKGFVDEVIGEPVLLAGHSMGAMIALDFAKTHPDHCYGVAALNAVHRRSPATALAVKQRADALKNDTRGDVASAPVKRWFGEYPCGIECEAAIACRNWLACVDRRGYAAAYTVFANDDGLSDVEFAQLSQPHLFLTGAEDVNSTPEMSYAMAQLAPQAEAIIIPGARHLAQLTHAAQVNAALGRFFARCEERVPDPALAAGEAGVRCLQQM